jgi:hypothetical protein
MRWGFGFTHPQSSTSRVFGLTIFYLQGVIMVSTINEITTAILDHLSKHVPPVLSNTPRTRMGVRWVRYCKEWCRGHEITASFILHRWFIDHNGIINALVSGYTRYFSEESQPGHEMEGSWEPMIERQDRTWILKFPIKEVDIDFQDPRYAYEGGSFYWDSGTPKNGKNAFAGACFYGEHVTANVVFIPSLDGDWLSKLR